MAVVQTAGLSSFLSSSEVVCGKLTHLGISQVPLLWLQHSSSPHRIQCGYDFKPGLALLIAFKVATALYRNALGFGFHR